MHKVKANRKPRDPAGKKRPRSVQYTLRGIPPAVDDALRRAAAKSGQSLNELAVEVLARGLGLDAAAGSRHDWSRYARTWVEDPQFDEAIKDFERIDPADWK